MSRGYGLIQPRTGYYLDAQNLFYYTEADHSIMLVATPGGGKRVVFKKGHNLYGPLYATIFADGNSALTGEAEGLSTLQNKGVEVERTTGSPVPAPMFAWLDSLEDTFADRKPFVRRPAFWATVSIGVLGVGYFIYSRTAKKA